LGHKMKFRSSRLYAAWLVVLAVMMTAAAYFVTTISGDDDSFKKFMGYFGVFFFGASGLVSLGTLARAPKVIEVSDAGFQYSDWPDQFINWTDLEDIHLGLLGSGVTLQFKNKHHTIFYKYPPRRPLLGKAPKEGELTVQLLRFSQKERAKIQAAVWGKWVAGSAGPRVKEAIEDYSELIDQAFETIVEKIAFEESLDVDDLFDKLETLLDSHQSEIAKLLGDSNFSYQKFEDFVRSLHRNNPGEVTRRATGTKTSDVLPSERRYQHPTATDEQPLESPKPVGQYGARKNRFG